MRLSTSVSPAGCFIYGIHQPHYRVANLRQGNHLTALGETDNGEVRDNRANFPIGDIVEEQARPIFEIPNAFPFRGTTYIDKGWADEKAADPARITLPGLTPNSFCKAVSTWPGFSNPTPEQLDQIIRSLPAPLALALATTSTDPDDLVRLARLSCDFVFSPESNMPNGLIFAADRKGRNRPVIHNHPLFEAVANNPCLPDPYKEVMVLRPGAQGGSEIVGDWQDKQKNSHVFEYLRRNSYIPFGHYAANFANDCVRYDVQSLSLADLTGLRHLYYQRTFVRLAAELGLELAVAGKRISEPELEGLRQAIMAKLAGGDHPPLQFTATLWGWNFGFDFAPSLYRLHASHQQIHQQYALLPDRVACPDQTDEGIGLPAYGCGDQIADFTEAFKRETGVDFFSAYLKAIRNNTRLDANSGKETSLIVYEDEHVMLFVPKAQTSQWELNLMTVQPIGNILEADLATRNSIDRAMLISVRVLAALGARLITNIEYPKRFNSPDSDQRLIYAFLPRLPESPGAFSEAQLRWINGHYPEDFAGACRARLGEVCREIGVDLP